MRPRLTTGAALLGAALVVAACSSPAPSGAAGPGIELSASPSTTGPSTTGPTASASTSASPSSDDPSAPGDASTAVDQGARLDVEDQLVTTSVALDEVTLTRGSGFVAVFAGDRLLGSAAVRPGVALLRVPVTSPPAGTSELVAVLYRDDGDGVLDVDRDAVVVREGEQVAEDFRLREH